MDIIIGAQVTGAVNGLKQVNTQLVKTEQTANKVTAKTKTDFTNLNRVIQDMPFGFQAIQNNITQLVPSAGALGLAISVATAAFTFAQVGLTYWTRGLKEAKEQTDEINKSLAGANTEITKVSALFNVAKNLNESTATRTNAIKELQKEYPGYLSNLNLENINSQEAANAIGKLSDALARKAKVQAISNLLTKANEKLLEAQNAQVFESLNAFESFFAKLTKGRGAIGFSAIQSDAKAAAKNISEAQSQVDRLTDSLTSLTQEQARGNEFSLLSPTAPKRIKDTGKSLKQLQRELSELLMYGARKFNFPASLIAPYEPTKILEPITRLSDIEAQNALKTMRDKLQKAGLKVFSNQGILTNVSLLNDDEVKKNFEKYKSYLEDFAIQVGPLISEAWTSITDAIASGKNPFAGIFEMLGGVIQQLGKQMIALSPLLGAIKIAVSTLNPVLGLAAGAALVALGSLLKGIPKFATGGVVTKPTLALVGEQGPERISPLGYEGRAGNVMTGEVVFNISGQNLRGILRRADQAAYNTN